ncbi:MAG: 2,4-dihydroxyhept-2-ene-1,7-dioic acid aldolase [Candidatus Cloacimonadota bacterium]|nr:MAG: 2,4-dihydroxyhept-2-ene-1,7-dioic acid aldolase [Candidatus Cloacimonadota bacterium]
MSLKQRFLSKDKLIGSWLTMYHPSIADIMATSGFDWITIDMEHSSISTNEAQILLSIMQNQSCPCLIRVAKNDEVLIKKAMDIGADGVIVPNIKNAVDAKQAINHMKYPPTGTRGVGLYRAQKYGYGFEEYKNWLENKSTLILQIEHIDAVNNIEEILLIDGIDAYIIGPYDLSASMGKPGKFDDSDVIEAISKVKKACLKHNKSLGFHEVSSNPDNLIKKFKEGFDYAAFSLDFFFLADMARDGIKKIRGSLNV